MPRILVLLLMTCLLLGSTGSNAADDTLTLHAGHSIFTPSGQLRYWVDANPQSTEQDAEQALHEGRFQRVERWPPTFGFAEGVHWFALNLRNADHADDSWLYVVEYALLDHLDLHLRYDDGRE